MTAPVTPLVLSVLQEMKEKSHEMSNQGLGHFSYLVTTLALTYDIEFETQACNGQRWWVTGVPSLHV